MADFVPTDVEDVQHGIELRPLDPLFVGKKQPVVLDDAGDLIRRELDPRYDDRGITKWVLQQDRTGPLNTISTRYNTYAGTDIVATILVPHEKAPLILGELQTISYSIHRENSPVRTLGSVNPAGFVRGPRTIAGSLVFTQFDQYAFYRLQSMRDQIKNNLFPLADMIPPFDIILTFANELGMVSKLKIFGVTIVDEGGTMSVDDLMSEQTYTYMARGIQPLVNQTPDGGEIWSKPDQPLIKQSSNVIVFRG